MSTFKERVRLIRTNAKLSQKDFAASIGVSRGYVSRLETEDLSVQDRIYKLLCSEFNVNDKWLRTGDGEMYNRALLDSFEIAESARGINPADPYGDDKLELFQLAATLLHQFKRVSYSCESVEELLTFFSYPSFADQLGYILSIYSDAQNDPGSSLMKLKLFNALFEKTFDLTREIKRLKLCGKERARAFDADPRTKYAEDYYREIMQELLDEAPEAARSVSGLAAAGAPLYDEGNAEEMVSVPPKYLDRDRYFIIKAKGDSMEPRIMDGDYVVVERNADPAPREIALVRVEDDALEEGYVIKRYTQSLDQIKLLSINPAYNPLVYPLSALRSAERVVHIIRSSRCRA